MTISEIAKQYSVAKATVSNAIKFHNIETKSDMKLRILSENENDIRARYNQGERISSIAGSYGVGQKTLVTKMDELGITRRDVNHSTKIIEKNLDNIIARANGGESQVSIAKSLGVPVRTLNSRLSSCGVISKSAYTASKLRNMNDEIKTRNLEGESLHSISKSLGVKSTTVAKHIDHDFTCGKYFPFDTSVYKILRCDRLSNAEIAKIFGYGESTLYKILNELNIDSSISAHIKPTKNELSLKYANASAHMIALELNVSKKTVLRWLSEYDIAPICNREISTPHKIVIDFLESIRVSYAINSREVCNLEADILIKEYNLVIEVNGLYWHSEHHKDKNYHKDKKILFNKHGYQVIFIREDEIFDVSKFNIFKNIILKRINYDKSIRSVGARKCSITHPSNQCVRRYLNRYHILGSCLYSNATALEYNGDIVSLITTVNSKSGLCLNRYCNSGLLKIVGGYERLIKSIGPHYTFADYDYCDVDDNVYERRGYTKVGEWNVDYMYTNGIEISHKFNFRKNRLKKRFNIEIEGKTESELTRELGYYKYYTAGRQKYAR